MKRTDRLGEWESTDGIGWLLVTPSAEFAAQVPNVVPEPGPLNKLADDLESGKIDAKTALLAFLRGTH